MALLADGWHMATQVGALGIAAFAYSFARRHADAERLVRCERYVVSQLHVAR